MSHPSHVTYVSNTVTGRMLLVCVCDNVCAHVCIMHVCVCVCARVWRRWWRDVWPAERQAPYTDWDSLMRHILYTYSVVMLMVVRGMKKGEPGSKTSLQVSTFVRCSLLQFTWCSDTLIATDTHTHTHTHTLSLSLSSKVVVYTVFKLCSSQ